MPTFLQNEEIASRVSLGGERISAPYRGVGLMRTWARWREARGFRPLPNSVSLRTLVQAPKARASLLVKCWWVDWLSCSQKPSHLMDLEGEMEVLSRDIGPEKERH